MVAGHFDAMFPAEINGGQEDLLRLQLLLSQQLDMFSHKRRLGIAKRCPAQQGENTGAVTCGSILGKINVLRNLEQLLDVLDISVLRPTLFERSCSDLFGVKHTVEIPQRSRRLPSSTSLG